MFIIKSSERGYFKNDWLESFHSFSFASYYNPQAMNYESLRVVNDDIIAPKKGFDTHFHRDMEIITYVVEGAITHRDNLGNNYEITAGNFQIMSAGSGIYHSEFNLQNQPCRIIQSWIEPSSLNIQPRHELINNKIKDKFVLIASCYENQVATKIFSWAEIYILEAQNLLETNLPQSFLDKAWIQVVEGEMMFNNLSFKAGDGYGFEVKSLQDSQIKIKEKVKILLFFL